MQWLTFVSFSKPLRLPNCSQALSALSALTSVHSWTISLSATLHASTAQYVGVRTCLRWNFLFKSGKYKNISSLQGKMFLGSELTYCPVKVFFQCSLPCALLSCTNQLNAQAMYIMVKSEVTPNCSGNTAPSWGTSHTKCSHQLNYEICQNILQCKVCATSKFYYFF
jgi:hypothetical protein